MEYEPPSSLDEALGLIRRLIALPPAERCGLPPAMPVPSSPDALWPAVVREVIDPAGGTAGPRIIHLLHILEHSNLSREQAKAVVARLMDAAPQALEAWADWHDVASRDELRLRLDVLGRCECWSESLVDFVTFFFRASVSDLYQTAAITVGRRLHRSAGLRQYLARFAQQRGVRLDEPIVLTGRRAPRRLLIALSAARGTSVPDLTITSQPLPIARDSAGSPTIAWPEHSADLFIMLLALELHLRHDPGSAEIGALVDHVLERTTQVPLHRLSRTVVQRFGALLVLRQPPHASDLWWRLFVRLRGHLIELTDGGLAQRMKLLMMFDEWIRTLVLLPEQAVRPLLERLRVETAGTDRRFLELRALAWCGREHPHPPAWRQFLVQSTHRDVHQAISLRPAQPPLDTSAVLDLFESAAAAPSSPEAEGPTMLQALGAQPAQVQNLDRLLATLDSPAMWLSHDEGIRALLIMLLLDQMQHSRIAAEQLGMVLARHGVGAAGGRSAGLRPVLLRVLAWEQSGAEHLIEPNMLHQIDDLRVLLALVPTERRSDVLAPLADAFEHQIRLRLRSDPTWSVEALLSLMAVRRPHRGLYAALAAVCQDRTYLDVHGKPVPLQALIAVYAHDIPAGDMDGSAADAPGDLPAPLESHDELHRTAARLCERLNALGESSTDVRSRLIALADLIGESRRGEPARSGTVMALMAALYAPDEPVLRCGYPPWSDEPFQRIAERLSDDLGRLRANVHAMLPERWVAGDAAREAANHARDVPAAACEVMCPSLPGTVALSLQRAVQALDGEVDRWTQIIEHVVERWSEERLHPHELDLDRCSKALADVVATDHPVLREQLLGLLWHSLREWAAVDGREDPWSKEIALLDWSLDHAAGAAAHDTATWRESQAHTWAALLEAAMVRQHEQRVRHLIEHDRYAPLRRLGPSADVLHQARRWCLDRYLLTTARRARTDMYTARSRPVPTWPAALGAVVANYSTIWVALLMGAIFMLDFGDAWTAMADPEVGDVRGITLSFLIAIFAAYLYIYINLRQRSQLSPGQSPAAMRRSHLLRAGGFAGVCLLYSLLIVTILWWLLSRTDEVVLGPWAVGHIIVWSGFAIFTGVFLGLLTGGTRD